MNKYIFLSDLRNLMKRKTTIISIVLIMLCAISNYYLILSEQPNINNVSSFESFVAIQGGGAGLLFIVLPLTLTILTGDMFIKERNSSVLSFSLVKIDIKTYIKNKLLSLGLINFLFMVSAQVLILVCAIAIFPTKNSHIDQGYVIFAKNLLYSKPFIYCAIIILNSGLMSIFFSFFSIIISLIFKNIYAAIMLPYVVFVGVSQILMAMPLVIGLSGIKFYNFSPLVMSGDYIAIDLNIFIVSIYWIMLIVLSYKYALYLFNKKFKNEKLFI